MQIDKSQLTIHRIWIGETLPPEFQVENQKLNSSQIEFFVKNWDLSVLEMALQNSSPKIFTMYDKMEKLKKYYFMKYYVIYKNGGFFLSYDYDIPRGKLINLLLKEATNITFKVKKRAIFFKQSSKLRDLFNGFYYCDSWGITSSNFFYSERNHPVLKKILIKILFYNSQIEENYKDYDTFISLTCGDYLLTKEIKKYQSKDNSSILIRPFGSLFIFGSPLLTSFLKNSKSIKCEKPRLVDKFKNITLPGEWDLIKDVKNLTNKEVSVKKKIDTVVVILLASFLIVGSMVVTFFIIKTWNEKRKLQKAKQKQQFIEHSDNKQ
jgi:hypothetical protein